MKQKTEIQFAQLVDMTNPTAIFEEVKYNFIQYYHITDFLDIRTVFRDLNNLFEGNYPGYRACNTKFHDINHSLEALLALSRLIDGYNLKNPKLPVNKVKISLIATLLHDTGYIQTADDLSGTGAKYTLNHVNRSIVFIKKYFTEHNYNEEETLSACRMVSCTGLNINISSIKFPDKKEKTLGLMLGTADLLGQMSSRNYLEKLIFLYQEFKEAGISSYKSEFDLLNKTIGFYEFTKKRLSTEFENVNKYVYFHFAERYKIKKDLYEEAISRQINYLKKILSEYPDSYRTKLKRTSF